MKTLKYLNRFHDQSLLDEFNASHNKDGHCFNPSFLDGTFSFSRLDLDQKHTETFVTRSGTPARLGGYAARLHEIDGQKYVIHNSGNASPNMLWAQPADPVGNLVDLEYIDRKDVEKNWSILNYEDEVIAVYSLKPLKILIRTETAPHYWKFELLHEGSQPEESLHIGTPFIMVNGQLMAMANRHVQINSISRVIVGEWISLNLDTLETESHSQWVYDLESTFGMGRPFNTPRTVSCSYFTGIAQDGDDVLLSYGVNDHRCEFARVPLSELMQS